MASATPRHHSRVRRAAKYFAVFLVAYFLVAYLAIPFAWRFYADRHPSFDDNPRITTTGDGHPGDAVNVALVGDEAQVKAIMAKAHWSSADPLGLKSDLEIAEATVLERSYKDAPVSNLFLFGRKEDLAFEQPVGDDPRKRHHVRFWRAGKPDESGRTIWLGAATFDERVGLSHTTGQITHHTAADIDAEREHVIQTVKDTGDLAESYYVDGYHTQLSGKNGGGDPWRTDGRLEVGVIRMD